MQGETGFLMNTWPLCVGWISDTSTSSGWCPRAWRLIVGPSATRPFRPFPPGPAWWACVVQRDHPQSAQLPPHPGTAHARKCDWLYIYKMVKHLSSHLSKGICIQPRNMAQDFLVVPCTLQVDQLGGAMLMTRFLWPQNKSWVKPARNSCKKVCGWRFEKHEGKTGNHVNGSSFDQECVWKDKWRLFKKSWPTDLCNTNLSNPLKRCNL